MQDDNGLVAQHGRPRRSKDRSAGQKGVTGQPRTGLDQLAAGGRAIRAVVVGAWLALQPDGASDLSRWSSKSRVEISISVTFKRCRGDAGQIARQIR